MEVHHHPNVGHGPKKWKEYFFEYLMIVMAVTTGFFAESFREYKTDREKESKAIESVIKCLASDTVQLNNIIYANTKMNESFDNFIKLKNADLLAEENKKMFYQNGTAFYQDWYFKMNDAAIQQIKYSGMLRLIKKQNIIDSIFGYELKNKVTTAQEADCYVLFKTSILDYRNATDFTHLRDSNVVSYSITNNYVSFHYKDASRLPITSDKEKLNLVFNNATITSVAIEAYIQFMQEQLDYARRLIETLNKEYGFQGD